MRVLVSGQVANACYQGGAAWVVAQHLSGLRRLGHDVHFLEPIAAGALQPAGTTLSQSENAAFFRDVVRWFGLEDRSALIDAKTGEGIGPVGQVLAAAREADLLLNLSGTLRDLDLVPLIPVKAYVDIDPGFTQLWHSEQGIDMGFAGHTHFVTIGERIGLPGCDIPACGLDWIPARQPVVLDLWPYVAAPEAGPLTTIANWRGYGSVQYGDRFFGQKAHSFRSFFEAPMLSDERFEPAISIHAQETNDIEALHASGWTLHDPLCVASTPETYQAFLAASKAELGIAKSGYVLGNTGWFSDRSACYLASGRPVLAQDTGFAGIIPSGEGLLSFDDMDGLLAAIDNLNSDYARHCRSARDIAEAYFDACKVLPALLDRLFARTGGVHAA